MSVSVSVTVTFFEFFREGVLKLPTINSLPLSVIFCFWWFSNGLINNLLIYSGQRKEVANPYCLVSLRSKNAVFIGRIFYLRLLIGKS